MCFCDLFHYINKNFERFENKREGDNLTESGECNVK